MKGDAMDVRTAIEKRRAFRALERFDATDDIIAELAGAARLAASCFNNQPWRFVFVTGPDILERMHEALSRGNEWARKASMIIAAFGKKDDDCLIKEREYYLFDIGMAVSAMVLRATEMGLVAHPIAGYSPSRAKEILGIPEDRMLITLVIVGKKSENIEGLTDAQKIAEAERPARRDPAAIYSVDRYDPRLE